MTETTRNWVIGAEDEPRGHVPLLVGLMGPSGGGKTGSALRLARGMQEVIGGDIYGIDTESGRMKHFKDAVRFKHVPFEAPFSSAAYLEIMRLVVSQGAKIVIVDSMSHEHSGEGGYLDYHDQELNRFVPSGDQKLLDKNNMRAWIKPSESRKKLILGMLQLDANFIFTFRAKETVKPTTGGGITELGFMPIAGAEFLYEMTTCCLLMPAAGGVPTWKSVMPGERMMIKPARQFDELFEGGGVLSETHGRGLARWARGEDIATPRQDRPEQGRANTPPPAEAPQGDPTWDHVAWARGFEESLDLLKTSAEVAAMRSDESNKDLFKLLGARDPERAKALLAKITGRGKALRDQEAAKVGEKIGDL